MSYLVFNIFLYSFCSVISVRENRMTPKISIKNDRILKLLVRENRQFPNESIILKQHSNMANNTSSTSANSASKLVRCTNCLHAKLHRYGNNPILAACKCKPQPDNERFPYQVEVASVLRHCSDWKQDTQTKEVELRSKVA